MPDPSVVCRCDCDTKGYVVLDPSVVGVAVVLKVMLC